jgi:hypothetical protein
MINEEFLKFDDDECDIVELADAIEDRSINSYD